MTSGTVSNLDYIVYTIYAITKTLSLSLHSLLTKPASGSVAGSSVDKMIALILWFSAIFALSSVV